MKAKTLHSLAIKHLAKYLTPLNSTRYQAKRSYEKLKKNQSLMVTDGNICSNSRQGCDTLPASIKGEKI